MKDDEIEEVFSYNEISDFMWEQEDNTIEWKFKGITVHEEPLKLNHSKYNGSICNVMIK